MGDLFAHGNLDLDSVKRHAAPMGYVLTDSFVVTSRSKDPNSQETEIIGDVAGRGLWNINPGDVLARVLPVECSDTEEIMAGPSSSRSDNNLVFAHANGLPFWTPFSVAGVSLTSHNNTGVTSEKVTYTTSGMVTVNNNSPVSIAAGDTVIVSLPHRGVDNRFIKAPTNRRNESDAFPLQLCSANKFNTHYFSRQHSAEFVELEDEIERRIHARHDTNDSHLFTYGQLIQSALHLCMYEDEDADAGERNIAEFMCISITATNLVNRIKTDGFYDIEEKAGLSCLQYDIKNDINSFFQQMESERIRTQRHDGFSIYSAIQHSLKLFVDASVGNCGHRDVERWMADGSLALIKMYIDVRFNHEQLVVVSRDSRLGYENILGIAVTDTSRLEPLTVLRS